jgi:hypothetical protein
MAATWLGLRRLFYVPRRAGGQSWWVATAAWTAPREPVRAENAVHGALLRCAFPEQRRSMIRMLRWSDGEREVVECRAEPVVAGDFGSDVVVTAAQILHEGVTGGEDPH